MSTWLGAGALTVIAGLVALAAYAVRRAFTGSDKLAAATNMALTHAGTALSQATLARQLQEQLDDAQRAVDDRDRALAAKEQAIATVKATLGVAVDQRDRLQRDLDQLRDQVIAITKDNPALVPPAVVGDLVRGQLGRLRALAEKPRTGATPDAIPVAVPDATSPHR